MLKLREKGLFTADRSKSSPFAGIVLGTHNENDGANFQRKIMIVQVITNPAPDETIGIGTKTYTFKASGATGDQINVGGTEPDTAANIAVKINADKRDTGCTAYLLGDPTLIILVAEVVDAEPVFTADGAKIVEDNAWTNHIHEGMLEQQSYFKIALTDADAKPIVLVERNPGTYHNFLY